MIVLLVVLRVDLLVVLGVALKENSMGLLKV
jgi:hypothetical protein